jgi:hypothetical protein
MNGVPKLSALAATVLLALVLAACGGGSSTSTTGPTTSTQKEGEKTATAAGAGKKAGSGGNKGKSSDSGEAEEAREFVPKQHSDSGGGSKQFRAPKGSDNSIQDYGAEAGGSEFDQAATTLHNFLDARAEGNWAAACSYMSPVLIKSLETLAAHTKELKGCAEILGKLTNPAAMGALRAEAAQANVASLRVKGKQAFVIYTGPKGAVIAMGMTPEGGIWKVSNLSGTPLN